MSKLDLYDLSQLNSPGRIPSTTNSLSQARQSRAQPSSQGQPRYSKSHQGSHDDSDGGSHEGGSLPSRFMPSLDARDDGRDAENEEGKQNAKEAHTTRLVPESRNPEPAFVARAVVTFRLLPEAKVEEDEERFA